MNDTFVAAAFGSARQHVRKARQARRRGDEASARAHIDLAMVRRGQAKAWRVMMNENLRTRAALLASFYAACRKWDGIFTMPMTAASCAGMLLHMHVTTRAAMEACARMPGDGPWPLAGRYLAELFDAEGADTVPPAQIAAGGGR